MLWANVSWSERLYGLGGFHKLLVLPLVFACFPTEQAQKKTVLTYLLSCTVLLILSWTFTIWPRAAWGFARFPGVPVKDFQAQSGEFVICAFALLHYASDAIGVRNYGRAAVLIVWSGLFIADVFYVATGRTQLVAFPILLLAFGYQRDGWRGMLVITGLGLLLITGMWLSSSYFRDRALAIPGELELSKTNRSERIAFYKKSVEFITQAPLTGHGTGTIPELFRQSSAEQQGANAIETVNPHNQELAVAIQLGLPGGAILIAMWLAHLLLFSGSSALERIGLLFVLQNVISNQFNTHLFDFTQGWTYVFAVGILGGPILESRRRLAARK